MIFIKITLYNASLMNFMKTNQIIKKFLNKKFFGNKTILITGANGVWVNN